MARKGAHGRVAEGARSARKNHVRYTPSATPLSFEAPPGDITAPLRLHAGGLASKMLQTIVEALDASFEEFKAECDATQNQHVEWLRETVQLTEKQLLNHTCVLLRHSKRGCQRWPGICQRTRR